MSKFLQVLIDTVAFFLNPIASFCTALTGVVSLVLWCVANPQSAVNLFICKIIDVVSSVFPSTPPELKISTLLASLGGAVPLIGYGIFLDIAQLIFAMFSVVVIVKIYKLIPFKAT